MGICLDIGVAQPHGEDAACQGTATHDLFDPRLICDIHFEYQIISHRLRIENQDLDIQAK